MKRLDIWNSDPAPENVTGATGSGKMFTDIGPRACTYTGSMMTTSVKPELADLFLGRNVDPSPAFRKELAAVGLEPGVDPTGITRVRFHKGRFRSFLFDPYSRSVYGGAGLGNRYTFLCDIPGDDPNVGPARTMALCRALIPGKENSTADPFFENAPRSTVYAGIGHVLTTFPEHLRTLPVVADFLMGRDPETGGASPDQFRKNLRMMMNNPRWGGTIAGAASRLVLSGEKSFGSVNYEIGMNLAWTQGDAMRRHLSGPSQFSYADLGRDDYPVAVWVIPSAEDLDGAQRYMRAHVALMIAVRKAVPKAALPRIPICATFDECRQYIGKEAAEAAMVLRSAKVKQAYYWQSVQSAIQTLGDGPFQEYAAQATLRFYGLRTVDDCEWLSRYLGFRLGSDGTARPLADAQTLRRLLAVNSNLQLVLPYGNATVMRLERRGLKDLRTREGLRVRGLPLDGHFDDHLA